MNDIDVYIARFRPDIQARLLFIRQTALRILGAVDERLCHSLPAFARNGHVFMFYGAYKAHVSICVGYDWVDFLKVQYPQYTYTKATIIFSNDDPFPEDMVQVICALLKQGPDENTTQPGG